MRLVIGVICGALIGVGATFAFLYWYFKDAFRL